MMPSKQRELQAPGLAPSLLGVPRSGCISGVQACLPLLALGGRRSRSGKGSRTCCRRLCSCLLGKHLGARLLGLTLNHLPKGCAVLYSHPQRTRVLALRVLAGAWGRGTGAPNLPRAVSRVDGVFHEVFMKGLPFFTLFVVL